MKTKLLAQLVIILLIAAISCTKESSNMTTPVSPVTQESNDVLAESLDNDINSLPIAGKWTLHYGTAPGNTILQQ